jgi:tRNA (guanosine-2'-O-)-methyltransferase
MTGKTLALSIAALAMCATGCTFRASAGVRTRPPPPPPSATVQVSAPPPTATVQVAAPQVESGVVVVESSCTQGAQEACNGLDDNCNGQIDEGCGYQSGNVQITLAWQTGADIDLHVFDPAGEEINYAHTASASGGNLDHDGRGNCTPREANNTIENVFWQTPPSGTYRVMLHYYGECNSGAGPTQSTLSISVGGQIIGAYQYTLNPDQRVDLASFTIQ